MRLFVAVDLDAAGRASIEAEQKRLRRLMDNGSTLKWVRPEHLHMTLVFLGEVDEPKAAECIRAIDEPVSQPSFDVVYAGLGVFPSHGAPRALWIGAAEGADELRALQQEIAGRVSHLGLALDARPFSPHLTLARWKTSRTSDRRRLLDASTGTPLTRVRVDRATLYQSHLSAAGPSYTERAHATLSR